ncbi:MAG: GNAT family N-acetyltransferase [Gammaproteobacteria bacterium]|jgi:predicted GNAT family N-acyltransferase|nr:GNAT family N-acetyltransferase [Gammaproteobacteria bacterium]
MTNKHSVATVQVRLARWPQDEPRIHAIRETVFVKEQGVPADLEWDGKDAGCLHVIAELLDGAKRDAVGTGRIMPNGKIGRMAVLGKYRGKGIGGQILAALVEAARARGQHDVYLHAQSHALAFYQRFGFEADGEEFQEAGIPHRKMHRQIEHAKRQNEQDPNERPQGYIGS